MIDTSDDAIQADLERAAHGGPAAATWIAWAQVRATLATRTAGPASEATGRPAFLALPTQATSPDIQIAVGPFGDSYAVPTTSSWEDRVTAAARMLQVAPERLERGLAEASLGPILEPAWDAPAPPEGETTVNMPEPAIEAPADPDFELDIEEDENLEDAFTEAGGTLEDLEKADSIDDDFFADERKARDR